MRGKNQKLKLLYLAKIMQEQTDDTHMLTMPQIINELAKYDIEAQRIIAALEILNWLSLRFW